MLLSGLTMLLRDAFSPTCREARVESWDKTWALEDKRAIQLNRARPSVEHRERTLNITDTADANDGQRRRVAQERYDVT